MDTDQRDNVSPTNFTTIADNGAASPPKWWRSRRLANILCLSVGFMFVSTSFFTIWAISNSVIHDMRQYGFRDGDGYILMAIMQAVQLPVTPITPLVVKMLGGKWSVIAGAALQLLYVGAFELNSRPLLFIAAGVFGAGMNLYWGGQGVVFSSNSCAATATKFAAIFWVVFNFAQIWGNIVVAITFNNLVVIDDATRRITFAAVACMIIAGCAVFLFIKEIENANESVTLSGSLVSTLNADHLTVSTSQTRRPAVRQSTKQKLMRQCRTTLRLLSSAPLLLSIGYFIFIGYNKSLYSSPIPTAIGFNKHFGDARKQLMGVAGFCTGVAEIVGGFVLIICSDYVSRTVVWSVGTIFCAVAMGFSALNMPLNATLMDSSLPTVLFGDGSSVTICIICAFLFGLSDCATAISMFSIVSDVFGRDHTAAVVDKSGGSTNLTSVADAKHQPTSTSVDAEVDKIGASLGRVINLPDLSPAVDTNKFPGKKRPSHELLFSEHPENSTTNNVQQLERESSAAAFSLVNGTQGVAGTLLFFLSRFIRLDWYFYLLVPICIWSCVGYYIVERNYRAGKYQNYFRNIHRASR